MDIALIQQALENDDNLNIINTNIQEKKTFAIINIMYNGLIIIILSII